MHTFTLKSIYSVNRVQPVTPVQPWAGSVPKHGGTALPGCKNYLPLWKRRKREVDSLSDAEGLQGPGWMRRCMVTHIVLHQVTYQSHWFVVSPEEVVLMRAVHKHWCKAFSDVSVYKLLDLAQGWVAFQKLSTSTKICVNFNSLISNAKEERTKRALLSSLQYFNNFTIPSGKKDCVNSFLHKTHAGGNLNSAHMWGDSWHVSVPTCSCSSASPSSDMRAVLHTEQLLQIKLLILRAP